MALRITITVKPNSKQVPLVINNSGDIVVYVRQQAIGGRANEAVINLLAEYYDVPKTRVKIIKGHSAHRKVVEIIQ